MQVWVILNAGAEYSMLQTWPIGTHALVARMSVHPWVAVAAKSGPSATLSIAEGICGLVQTALANLGCLDSLGANLARGCPIDLGLDHGWLVQVARLVLAVDVVSAQHVCSGWCVF